MKVQTFLWTCGVCVILQGVLSLAQVTGGSISGTVTDSTGAVIPGTTVTVRNVETGITRIISTDAQGRYTAPQLGLGMYEVTAATAGFQTMVRAGIELTVGRQAVVDLTLQVGAVAETVTVTGEAPLLETTNATVADLVSETQMRELPLNGRSFRDLVEIQPGVVTDVGAPQSTLKGGGRIVMNGARPQQSLYLLDGVEIVDPTNNLPPVSVMGQTLGVDTIREFSVLQNSYGAQYGRAIGGIVNAVTRSGNNELHGSAFEFLRSEKLDAKNFFDQPDEPIPAFKRNQFGGTLGGPIVRDNTFFFFSYEGLRQSFGTTDFGTTFTDEARAGIITNCPEDPATGLLRVTCAKEEAIVSEVLPLGVHPDIQPVLALIPRGNGLYLNDGIQELRGSRTQTGRENYYMFRIDQKLSDNDNLFGRMVLDTSSQELPDAQFFSDGKTHPVNSQWGAYTFLTLDWMRIITPTVLNSARVGFSRNNNNQMQSIEGEGRTDASEFPGLPPQLEIVPGEPWGGPLGIRGISIPGGHNGPGSSVLGAFLSSPLKFATNTFTFYDSMRVTMGRHSLDFGVDIRRFQQNMLRTSWQRGDLRWRDPSKNFLTAAQPGFCTGSSRDCRGMDRVRVTHTITPDGGIAAGDPYRGYRQTYTSWYVQDDIKLLPNLTLNIGVRWDKITPPVEVNQKVANILDVLRDDSYTQLGKEPLFSLRNFMGGFFASVWLCLQPRSENLHPWWHGSV